MGKPIVSGTRITVELILEKLAAGETIEQILSEHPRLTVPGIRAAIAFAAEALSISEIDPGIDDDAVRREFPESVRDAGVARPVKFSQAPAAPDREPEKQTTGP